MQKSYPIEGKVREQLMMWEDKEESRAPLSNLQKDSYISITMQEVNDLPEGLPLYDNYIEDSMDGQDNRVQSIKTSEQFMKWYEDAKKKDDEVKEQDKVALMGIISEVISRCEGIHGGVEDCLELLTVLKTDYIRVATKTNALHEACEMMLDEQTKCLEAAESLNFRLKYFQEYQSINKKINGFSYGIQVDSILSMLLKVNECIHFMNQQESYKEALVYKDLFNQCLNKVLVCLKDHVFSVLKSDTNATPIKEMSQEELFVHLYGRFRTSASKLKAFIEKVEQNANFNSEYESCLSDLHRGYMQLRSSLLHPATQHTITTLTNKHHLDYCSLLQNSSSYLIHVCEDEYALYHQFFTLPSEALNTLFEMMCVQLYDTFRPHIIHMKHIETLAEICRALKTTLAYQSSDKECLNAFRSTCTQLLQDVQERLVFIAHMFIESDVKGYVPSKGDVTFTERMHLIKEISSNSNTKKNSDSSETKAKAPPKDADVFHNMWYPTIRRTLNSMSKLYECLDKETFQELSQDLISGCVISLINAKNKVESTNNDLSAEMFLIKHLLILREQIVPFQINHVLKETVLNFSHVKNAARGLFTSPSLMFALNNNNVFLQLLLEGSPGFSETYFDGKKYIDEQLKKCCEDFINTSTTLLIGNLHQFIKKYNAVKDSSDQQDANLAKMQPFSQPEALKETLIENRKAIKSSKALVKEALTLYLANEETEHILWKPIQSNVLQAFHHLHLLLEDFTEEEKAIIAAPSIEQIKLLLTN